MIELCRFRQRGWCLNLKKNIPQGLKPRALKLICGTARSRAPSKRLQVARLKALPFQNDVKLRHYEEEVQVGNEKGAA
jgi:hypothetical protein